MEIVDSWYMLAWIVGFVLFGLWCFDNAEFVRYCGNHFENGER
jgi:hypothetical protein